MTVPTLPAAGRALARHPAQFPFSKEEPDSAGERRGARSHTGYCSARNAALLREQYPQSKPERHDYDGSGKCSA